jgi:hypothetical protein
MKSRSTFEGGTRRKVDAGHPTAITAPGSRWLQSIRICSGSGGRFEHRLDDGVARQARQDRLEIRDFAGRSGAVRRHLHSIWDETLPSASILPAPQAFAGRTALRAAVGRRLEFLALPAVKMIAAPVVVLREIDQLAADARRTGEAHQFADAASHLPVMIAVGQRRRFACRQDNDVRDMKNARARPINPILQSPPASLSVS